jgi:tetratricopeptide (TPR) repeat protein
LAKRAVELTPTEGNYWNTLGAAHYRAGDWKAAAQTLKKSMELRKGGGCVDWFFLAMAHWQLGEKEQARQWYDKAVQWMDKNDPKNDELRRFRSEAAELLGVEKKNKSSRFGEREGRCVVAATRKPHRRGKAPVFGLSGRMMAMPSVF